MVHKKSREIIRPAHMRISWRRINSIARAGGVEALGHRKEMKIMIGDIVYEYVRTAGRRAQRFARAAGRKTVKREDVRMALEEGNEHAYGSNSADFKTAGARPRHPPAGEKK